MTENKRDEITREGDKTTYRPDDDRLKGKAIQSEARGEQGSADLSNTSSTQGGAAGKVNEGGDETTNR